MERSPPGPDPARGADHAVANEPLGPDSRSKVRVDRAMEFQGRIPNGIVVLESELPLPEGTIVTVAYRGALPPASPATRRSIQLPLVRSDRPGSRQLTADRLAELLDDEDGSA